MRRQVHAQAGDHCAQRWRSWAAACPAEPPSWTTHVQGFVAKPRQKEDGSTDMFMWDCQVPGKAGSGEQSRPGQAAQGALHSPAPGPDGVALASGPLVQPLAVGALARPAAGAAGAAPAAAALPRPSAMQGVPRWRHPRAPAPRSATQGGASAAASPPRPFPPAAADWEGGVYPVKLEFSQHYPQHPPRCSFPPGAPGSRTGGSEHMPPGAGWPRRTRPASTLAPAAELEACCPSRPAPRLLLSSGAQPPRLGLWGHQAACSAWPAQPTRRKHKPPPPPPPRGRHTARQHLPRGPGVPQHPECGRGDGRAVEAQHHREAGERRRRARRVPASPVASRRTRDPPRTTASRAFGGR